MGCFKFSFATYQDLFYFTDCEDTAVWRIDNSCKLFDIHHAEVGNGKRISAEFGRLRRGDVLVSASTTVSFNLVLPLLGAIVTDSGGLLSHAAIVSREYGIPGVVGCRDATALLKDGMQVRVDGNLGEVRVVGP